MDARRFTRAASLAAAAHAGQTRKGSDVPYIGHPLEVADLVAHAGGSEAMVLAAILHDVVEDSATTVETIAVEFGAEVAAMVGALTDAPEWDGLPRPERKKLQAQHLPDAPEGARAIKIADQTSNLRDILRHRSAYPDDRARTYLAGARLVVDACRGTSPALEAAFDAACADLEARIGATA